MIDGVSFRCVLVQDNCDFGISVEVSATCYNVSVIYLVNVSHQEFKFYPNPKRYLK